MKFLQKCFIVFCVIALNTTAFSQVRQFSENNEEFFNQLDDFFSNSSRAKELRRYHRDLKKYWNSGAIPSEEQKNIVETCNILLSKHGRAYPHFYNYFTAVQLFFVKDHAMPSYHEWDKALRYLITSKGMVTTNRFLMSSIRLLENNELEASSTATWRVARLRSFAYSFNEETKEVRITFPPTDLICQSAKNEFILYQAAGYYLPFENQWVGIRGKVSWERSGANSELVFADLGNYVIDMRRNTYDADSVWFTNKTYFQEPLLGKLSERTVPVRDPESVSYPRFQSYQQFFEIPDMYPGINYKGGLTMHGARVIGSGTAENPATLHFVRGDSTLVFCKSESFIFNKDNVVGRNTEISIYIQKDSIYHPGLLFRYDVATKQVSLIRNEDTENLSRAPYSNSYHMISMDFPQLTWRIDELNMRMGGLEGTTVNKASFESANYFRASRYSEIGMYDRTHPLIALTRLSEQKKSETFLLHDFSNFLRADPIAVEHLCLDLLYRGLITYDVDKKIIGLTPRIKEYIDARMGRIDYDVIQFDSEHDVRGLHNALLDLSSYNLEMTGVSKIQVSDSQNVIFYPRGSQITMSKNRDFTFDGIIQSGLFTFYGRGFDFNYDAFRIGLKNVDSLKIKVQSLTQNEFGLRPLVEVKNAIEYITGEILIDDPNNKSSIKDYPQYPIFDSKQHSYVFYDYPAIYGGVYDRKKFFFKVDPYVIDSINNFSTEGLFFDGEFQSASIFETMREKIVVQPDYSFGFTRITGSGGYPVYKGKGQFTDTINLSFKGLRGIGKIEYLNTHAKSSRGFTFFPDSTKGRADTYHIARQSKSKGAEYPEVNGEQVDILWEPYLDRWVSVETGKAFKMYGDTTHLTGGLIFTPKDLTGWGRYTFSEAIITANDFTFKEKEVLADHSDFDLASGANLSDMAFQTENVQTYVNYETKKANFKANDNVTVVQFPQNKYICYLNQFTWDMVTKQIELGNPKALTEDVEAELHFYSRLMSQDTINFKSQYAKYDLNNHIIDAHKVPYIDVADSRIIPHQDSIIQIRKEANMRTIRNATFVANRTNQYHTIYNATFNVQGKLDYSGTGYYDYIDETKQKQTMLFSHIGVDSIFRTFATGRIAEIDEFTLSPVYKYYGDVRMNAWRKDLTFTGNVLVANECEVISPNWFKFSSEIDPNEIYIPISDYPVSRNNDTIGASIYINNRPTHFYTSFLTPLKSEYDAKVVNASGYLFYDKSSRRYKIGAKEKIQDEALQGNLLTYHREYCNTYGEGKLNLAADLGQVKVEAYGNVTHAIVSNRVTMETFLTVDFMFDQRILNAIADTLINQPKFRAADLTTLTFRKGITELLGDEASQEIQSEIQLYGTIRRKPEELQRSIVFSHIDFVWDTVAFAYRSVGQLGVHSILGKDVNKMVDGYVEIVKLYAGDMLTIFFELEDKWYFFHYNRETMEFVSAEAPINLAMENIKEAQRVMNVPRREAQYKYQLSSEAVMRNFVGKFKAGEGYTNIAPPTIPVPGAQPQGAPQIGTEQQGEQEAAPKTDGDEYDSYEDPDDY